MQRKMAQHKAKMYSQAKRLSQDTQQQCKVKCKGYRKRNCKAIYKATCKVDYNAKCKSKHHGGVAQHEGMRTHVRNPAGVKIARCHEGAPRSAKLETLALGNRRDPWRSLARDPETTSCTFSAPIPVNLLHVDRSTLSTLTLMARHQIG